MSFTNAITTCFRRYASFSGRASRSELWWFLLFVTIVHVALSVLLVSLAVGALTSADGTLGPVGDVILWLAYGVSLLAALTLVVPTLALTWRRLHDTARTGACCFLVAVPGIGTLVLTVLWAMEGTRGPNRFGASPA